MRPMAAAGLRRGQGGSGTDGDTAAADADFADQVDEFDRQMRQMVDDALSVSTWTAGERMSDLEERLEREVRDAVAYEAGKSGVLEMVRQSFPDNPAASKESCVETVTPEQIGATLRSVLFNGLVEACDGTRVSYDTLPISVIQIGLCMTTYLDDGEPTSVGHRLYRHDMVRRHDNAEEELLAFLYQRAPSSKPDENGDVAGISDMLVRAIMEHGERYLFTERSKKPWRMGHGLPFPYEMMTGRARARSSSSRWICCPSCWASPQEVRLRPQRDGRPRAADYRERAAAAAVRGADQYQIHHQQLPERQLPRQIQGVRTASSSVP
jgi:hypothetical protein